VGIFDVLPDRGMSIALLMFAAFTWYFWARVRRRRVIIDDRGITLVDWSSPSFGASVEATRSTASSCFSRRRSPDVPSRSKP
jgi:hypothetical protein